MKKTPRDSVERVARIYKSNSDASRALGITLQAFSRICRQYGIETPHARRQGRSRGRRMPAAEMVSGAASEMVPEVHPA